MSGRAGSIGAKPVLREGQLSFFAAEGASDATALLKALFDQLRPGGYVGFLAYIERNEAHEAALSAMRTAVRDARRVATVAGFGPRFLHSTGQAYKGGPAGGVFLEITRNSRSRPCHSRQEGELRDRPARAGARRPGRARRARRGHGCASTSRETMDAGLATIGRLVAASLSPEN